MVSIRQGGCQCGNLRYEVRDEPLAVTVCHCTHCQSQSGSAFGMSFVVPREAFRVIAGEPRTWTTQADSGADKECVFCPECGVRIYNTLSSMPKTLNIKPGTLDDRSGLQPALHVWLSSRQPWVPLAEGIPGFDHNPRKA